MHISSDSNPINPTRPSSVPTDSVKAHPKLEATAKVGEADLFRGGLFAELASELKKMPEVRNDVVVSAAREIDTIDLKELGSRLAVELNRFDPADSK